MPTQVKADTTPRISKSITANIAKLDSRIPNATSYTKPKIETVRRLYESRNIRNITTALKIVSMLESASDDLKDIKKHKARTSKYDEPLVIKTYSLSKP